MANVKASKKSIRIIKRRTLINKSRKSRVKTFLRRVLTSVLNNDVEGAKRDLVAFESEATKAAQKGIYKKNSVRRKLSRLAKKIRNINTQVAQKA